MSADLERRYARLLRLYPAAYRRARGDELLETLLESAEDGRKWPAPREVRGLVLGAFRAHAGRDRSRSLQHSWLAAFRAAALMLLIYDIAGTATAIGLDLAHRGVPFMWSPAMLALNLVALTLGTCAVVATVRGRYRSAVATATVAFLATLVVTWSLHGPVFSGFWHFPLAIVLLMPLLRHRPPSPTGLLRYAPALPVLIVLTDQLFAQVFPDISGILQHGLVLALCLGSLLWLAVDERLAMALGLLLLNSVLLQLAFLVEGGPRNLAIAAVSMAITGVLPAVLLLTSGIAAQRRQDI